MVGENITRLVPYRPGKPIEEVKRELGLTEVIKLASNENPLGPSPRAVDAIREASDRVHLYPDAVCHDLRKGVSRHLNVPEDHLVFGNGSDDIIHLLGVTFLNPGDEVIQADPSFVRYEAAAILHHCPCHKVALRNWTHDLEAMAEKINEHTRMIFIANPNNPTGTINTADEVARLLERTPDRVIVVFDEAYFEFVESASYPDCLQYIREGRNVVVLRTFSKAYGLAGLRLGYGVARPEIAGYLNQVREPFNVSSIAQAAGVAALEDVEFLNLTRSTNRKGKLQLYSGFDSVGLRYIHTEGNFVWVDVSRDCRPVFDGLLRRGVIVRTGDIFGSPRHLRVTVGTGAENSKFLCDLEEVLKQ